jgi:hypothetical protein
MSDDNKVPLPDLDKTAVPPAGADATAVSSGTA